MSLLSICQTEEDFFGLTGETLELDMDRDEEDESETEQDSEEHSQVLASKGRESRPEGILERQSNLRILSQSLQQQGT